MACIFCQISAGEVASELLHQDGRAVAFRDINPRAPVHLLVVPRKHIPTVADLAPEDEALMGHLVRVANALAQQMGVAQGGYRLVVNCREDAGQVVPHLHLHLLAGRRLGSMG